VQLVHALSCPFGPHRNNRHNALRDALAKIIQKTTGQTPLIEQTLPSCSTMQHADEVNTASRSDVTWFTTSGPVHLDIMVTSAFTQAASAGHHATSVTPGLANNLAEAYKRRKYAPRNIIPIVFEAHGRFGNETLLFLRKLTNILPEPERDSMYYYAIQKLSTTLQQYNAITIESHLNHHMTPQNATTNHIQ
jgi:hypothetical protein